MLEVLSATVPIFLVVGVGFLCTRAGLFARTDMAILNRFVVKIALPLLVFVNVFGRSASEIFNPAYLLTYALASMAMFALAHGWAAMRRAPLTRAAYLGMAMGGTNNGFIGMSIFLIALPEVAGIAVGMDMIVDNVLIIPLTLFLAERAAEAATARADAASDAAAGGASATGSTALRTLGRSLRSVITQPMVLAIIAALALNALGVTVPAVLERSVLLLAQASSGVALFAIGGLLVGLKLGGMLADVAFSLVGKLLLMPAVAWGLVVAFEASGLPPMSPDLKSAVIITAALPTFSIFPAFASRHGEQDWATASTMGGTVLSFVTISAWMGLLTFVGWL
ncbi:MAG: AEC family transporter [Propionibacteriaceae bacterium]|nr:AEC family transporter [Propionibacteriaceae bacterium]